MMELSQGQQQFPSATLLDFFGSLRNFFPAVFVDPGQLAEEIPEIFILNHFQSPPNVHTKTPS